MTTEFVSTELILLAASVVLGILQLMVVSYFRSGQRNHAWTAGSGEQIADPLAGVAGRVERGFRNYLETFPFFATAILLVTVRETHTLLTMLGAHLYFWGRIAYAFLYAVDLPLAPALLAAISMLGILMEVAALFVK